MKKVMLVFGTRPEAIKMCPLVNELKQHDTIETVVCVTGQHKEMLDQVLDVFRVVPDYNLGIMKANQTLFTITTSILEKSNQSWSKKNLILSSSMEIPQPPLQQLWRPFIWASKWGMWRQGFGLTIFKAHILKSLTVKLLP